MTHNQPTEENFTCQFCGYRSELKLRECPECGKIARAGATVSKKSEPASTVDHAPRFVEKRIHICDRCGYQTPNSLSACPECGRRKFSVSVVTEETNFDGGQNTADAFDKYQAGKFLQFFGIGFFFIAALVFYGVGPTGKTYPRSGIIAEPGENWLGAFALIVVGIIISCAGTFLKR
jgi:hypothetical protein